MNIEIVAEKKLEYKGTRGMPYSFKGLGKVPNTGTWKILRPVIDYSKCIKCHSCWLHCPDNAIKIREDEFTYSDYTICKGCGACSEVCPVKCIQMQRDKKDGAKRSDLLEVEK